MKADSLSLTNAIVLPIILGVVAAVIVYAGVTGRTLPLVNDARGALIALLVVGMAMCAMGGISQVGVSGKWASPVAILGYLVGAAILIVAISVFAGWKLPYIAGDREAIIAIAGLMAVKYLIGTASYFLHLA